MLASLLAVTGCQNEEIVSNDQQKGNYSLTVNRLVDSRTYVKDDGTVVWSKNDKMYVYGEGVTGVLTLDDADAGETTGTFTGFVFGNPDNLKWAVFGDEVKGTANGAEFTISSITDPNSNSPMAGPIVDGNVQMEHLCGMVRITINNLPNNATVKLKGADIAGTAEWNGTVLTHTSKKGEITLVRGEDSDNTFEIPLFTTAPKDGPEEQKSLVLSVDGVECPINAPVKVGSLSQKAIMTITCITDAEGKVTGFSQAATTEEALKQALQTKGTVKFQLGESINLNETLVVSVETNATIDLNGHDLTINNAESTYIINNLGTLTLVDSSEDNSGSVTARGIYNGYSADGNYVTTAKIIIENGTYNAVGNDGGAAVFNYGIAEINGGTFTSLASYSLNSRSGSTMVVNDAIVTGGIYSEANSLIVNGGDIETDRGGSSHAIFHAGTSLVVNDGNFQGNGNEVINSNSSEAVINGGTFKKIEKASYLLGGANMIINGGTFIAYEENPAGNPVRSGVTIHGGTFNYQPTVQSGYEVMDNENGTWTVKITSEKLGSIFQEALANGESVELPSGTYDIAGYVSNAENFSVTGSVNTVIKTKPSSGDFYALGNASGTFEGVTIQGKQSGQYNGFAHAGEMVYRNCVIDGTMTIYSNSTFENCIFNLPKGCYIWTAWGANEVTYRNCTFNTAGKALLVYHESGTCTVNVYDCDFYASAGDKAGDINNQNCAAIEIGNHGKGVGTNTACRFTVNTSGNTYDSNFSGEWRIKVFDAEGSVTVNSTSYTSIAIDGKAMTIDANKNVTIIE